MKTNASIQIGTKIRYFRELAGMTQLQLAEKIPCEPSTLAHYETGKNLVSMTKLIRISEVLQVDLYKFFTNTTTETDVEVMGRINELLKRANKVQIGLIYNIISSILEF